MQPTWLPRAARSAGVKRSSATTSEMPIRPPGRSTRAISASALSFSGERLTTQFEMTTSTLPLELAGVLDHALEEVGVRRLSPHGRSRARARASRRSCRGRTRCPMGPTRFAERSTSIPPPEPRSSTVSPAPSSTMATGLPHPRLAASVPSGSAERSSDPYRPRPNSVVASSPQQPMLSQSQPHPQPGREAHGGFRVPRDAPSSRVHLLRLPS